MHESMSAFQGNLAGRFHCSYLAMAVVAMVLVTGCKSPFRGFAKSNSCATECECGQPCDELPECENCGMPPCTCGLSQCACTMPHCKCGHMKALYRVPCEKCGHFLHFCERSDYIGPAEPPRPPRFHPVPTQPVFAQDLP